MKKILGLDLGTTSIGWAVIKEDPSGDTISGMGCRIIPYAENEAGDFKQGTGESKNHQRTVKRTQRKGYDRYQLRRELLSKILRENGMLPEMDLFKLSSLDLYGLRAKAVVERIELKELGRIFLHLNQRRGYKHGIKEENTDKKQREFVEAIFRRWELIKGEMTVGQYIHKEIAGNPFYRIKDKIFPRDGYISEFDSIWKKQSEFYPELLNEQLFRKVRDEIIYYQRPLKSQKGLVSICEFTGFWVKNSKSKDPDKWIFTGPKTAPRSSPLAQISKLWESINNITITRINPETRKYEKVSLEPEKRKLIFDYLSVHENLSESRLFEIAGIPKGNGYTTNQAIRKRGIQGDLTRTAIVKAINGDEIPSELLASDLKIEEYQDIDRNTGEVVLRKRVSWSVENSPYYRLWHTLYSNNGGDNLIPVLVRNFSLSEASAARLASLDLTKGGYSNKSAKAIRMILPYLADGYMYSDACLMAGFRHSLSMTNEEKKGKILVDQLELIPKNGLRQPIVEKILNQMINVVNKIIIQYGRPDEIRVELARELKQSKQERNEYYLNANARDRQNKRIAERLEQEYHVKANRRNIEKWRLFHEVGGQCLYCNKPITLTQLLTGIEADIEHIIPRSLYFDDSFSNKTISHVACNKQKNQNTAYDYMHGKPTEELQTYVTRVKDLFHSNNQLDDGAQCLVNKINRTKYQRLLMEKKDIPIDFISRQLRETQYIARKAKEILEKVSVYVNATSGSVTERLRHLWGWDEILMQQHLPLYREAGLTEIQEIKENSNTGQREIIPGWSKRNDNRHHAIDALTIACTKQGFIQRINTLSTEMTREQLFREVRGINTNEKHTLLEKFLISKKPFSTSEVTRHVEQIMISFKSGKKVGTSGVRKITKAGAKEVVQTGILVPRGALSEESVYGKIRIRERAPIKRLFENPELIVDPMIKSLIVDRLKEFNNDIRKAIASTRKVPLYKQGNDIPIEIASMFREEYVIKYPLQMLKVKDLESIVDPAVREAVRHRLELSGNNEKTAFRDIDNNPIWINQEKKIPIRTVRCFTGLSSVVPLKFFAEGCVKGYVKPGNNHHIAIYSDKEGNLQEHVVTFWHAVERKKYGIPAVIRNPEQEWTKMIDNNLCDEHFCSMLPEAGWQLYLSMQQNEMFIMGMSNEAIEESLRNNDRSTLSKNLYRVQKIGSSYYTFRHHLETMIDDSNEALAMRKFLRIRSIKSLVAYNPTKIHIDLLGNPHYEQRP